jgi:hypothetical protein
MMCGGEEVWSHTFLTLEVDESREVSFTPQLAYPC